MRNEIAVKEKFLTEELENIRRTRDGLAVVCAHSEEDYNYYRGMYDALDLYAGLTRSRLAVARMHLQAGVPEEEEYKSDKPYTGTSAIVPPTTGNIIINTTQEQNIGISV